MKGRLNRLRRRSDEPASEPATGTSPTTDGQATQAQPATTAPPAGQAPDRGEPSFRHRGRARRRLRYLRRARELGFRDLGGLVFDQHRFDRRSDDLVRAKVDALGAIDRELRALEQALGERREITELREPGVSVCARCGALTSSDAHYCSACGTPQRGARTIAVGAAAPEGAPASGELAPAAQPVATTTSPVPQPAHEPERPADPAEARTAAHEATRPTPS